MDLFKMFEGLNIAVLYNLLIHLIWIKEKGR